MKNYLKFAIAIPAIVSLLISFGIFLKFWEKRKFDSYLADAVTFSNVPMPQGSLIASQGAANLDYNQEIRQGKVLLIFISTSCGACKKDVGTIAQVMPELDSKVKVYGVTIEEPDKAIQYIADYKLGFPLLLDKGAKIFTALSIKYFPTKVLLENGVIQKTWFGSAPTSQGFLNDLNLGEIGK